MPVEQLHGRVGTASVPIAIIVFTQFEIDGRWAGVTIFRAEPGEDSRSLQPLHTRVLADGVRSGASP